MSILYVGAIPVVCGGRSFALYDDCLEYSFALNSWRSSGLVLGGEVYLSGHAQDDLWGLVISGGYNQSGVVGSVLHTEDGTFFDQHTTMVVPAAEHCLAIIDNDR